MKLELLNDFEWKVINSIENLVTNKLKKPCNLIIRELDLREVSMRINHNLCFCGSGKKHNKCHSEIKENTAMAYLFEAFKIIDNDIKNADITPECPKKCSSCCCDYFDVSPIEFFAIFKFIQSRFLGHNLIRVHKQAQMIMPSFKPFYDERSNLQFIQPCIFLDNRNGCRIYEVRPLTCRMFGFYQNFTACLNAKNMLKIIPSEVLEHHSNILGDLDNKRLPAIPLVYWFGNPIVETDTRLKELYATSFENDIVTYIKFISDNQFGVENYSF